MVEENKSEMDYLVKEAVYGDNTQFTSLFFKQVPKDTAEEFKKLSFESGFAGHYGFTLKALIDQLIVQKESLSEVRLEEIEERLSRIEKMILLLQDKEDVEAKQSVKKTVGGRIIG